MKAVFFYTLKCSIVTVLLAFITPVFGQDRDTSLHVDEWVSNGRFTFTPQSATPQTGRYIQLTSVYDIRITGDSIISYLPYYGRAFVAPINPQDGGLEFTSTDFTSETKKVSDDKWEISMVTKALRDNYKLFFTIYNNGQAQLQVTSNNCQPIRFDGYVVKNSTK